MPICFQSALNFDPLPKNRFGVWGLEFGARLCSSPSLCGLEVINTEPNISRFGLQMFYLSIFTLQGSVGVTEHQRTGRKTLLKKQDMFINPAGKGFGGFFVPEILGFSISLHNFCPRPDSRVCKRLKSSLRGDRKKFCTHETQSIKAEEELPFRGQDKARFPLFPALCHGCLLSISTKPPPHLLRGSGPGQGLRFVIAGVMREETLGWQVPRHGLKTPEICGSALF